MVQELEAELARSTPRDDLFPNPRAELNVQRSYLWLFWSLALVGFGVDQASKYGIFRWLYNDGQGGRVAVIPGAFYLVADYSNVKDAGDSVFSPLRTWSGEHLPRLNHGALFGIGNRDADGNDSNLLFAIVSVAAAAVIIFWATRQQTGQDRWLSCALGLILAGTLGNLYDRVVFQGVRDFFHWNYLFDWPVFNVADSCLVCGAGLLLLQAFRPQPATIEPTAPTPVAAQAK
jgi:lipoprotein signal peptidase